MSEWLADGAGGFRDEFPFIAFGILVPSCRTLGGMSGQFDRPARPGATLEIQAAALPCRAVRALLFDALTKQGVDALRVAQWQTATTSRLAPELSGSYLRPGSAASSSTLSSSTGLPALVRR